MTKTIQMAPPPGRVLFPEPPACCRCGERRPCCWYGLFDDGWACEPCQTTEEDQWHRPRDKGKPKGAS